jgi:hypothetical protein
MRDVFQDLSAELLADGLMIRFRASGQSMSPTIRDGEAITVAPVSVADVRRGDILLYQNGRRLLAHRVVRIATRRDTSPRLTLRGDASVTEDEPIASAQVLGRVVSVERDGRELTLVGHRARLRRILGKSAARLKGLVSCLIGSDVPRSTRS